MGKDTTAYKGVPILGQLLNYCDRFPFCLKAVTTNEKLFFNYILFLENPNILKRKILEIVQLELFTKGRGDSFWFLNKKCVSRLKEYILN